MDKDCKRNTSIHFLKKWTFFILHICEVDWHNSLDKETFKIKFKRKSVVSFSLEYSKSFNKIRQANIVSEISLRIYDVRKVWDYFERGQFFPLIPNKRLLKVILLALIFKGRHSCHLNDKRSVYLNNHYFSKIFSLFFLWIKM